MDGRGQTSKTRRLELFWGSYSSIGHARWMETERGGRPRGAQVVVDSSLRCGVSVASLSDSLVEITLF